MASLPTVHSHPLRVFGFLLLCNKMPVFDTTFCVSSEFLQWSKEQGSKGVQTEISMTTLFGQQQ